MVNIDLPITLLAAVIGGMGGSLLTLAGTFFIRRYFYNQKETDQRKKLRSALVTEIENMDSIKNWPKKGYIDNSLPTTEFASK